MLQRSWALSACVLLAKPDGAARRPTGQRRPRAGVGLDSRGGSPNTGGDQSSSTRMRRRLARCGCATFSGTYAKPKPASAALSIWKVPLKTSWPSTRTLSSRVPFPNSQAYNPPCVGRRRLMQSSVTFEPGARTAWHTHPLGQTLIVTAGCGWVQREGGAIDELRPGDVVWSPPGAIKKASCGKLFFFHVSSILKRKAISTSLNGSAHPQENPARSTFPRNSGRGARPWPSPLP